jgi:outer membrane protein assembly factor BamB
MNQPMSLDRFVAEWMADNAPVGPTEELVDQILTATARQRPRPRWLALLQEPPMSTQTRILVGSPNGRLVIVATLLLIAALAAVGIGAFLLQQPKPSASDDWPGFRGDATHAGLAHVGPVGNPVVSWQASLGVPIQHDISIIGDVAAISSDDGLLTGLLVADGTKRWTFAATPPMSGPVGTDGTFYAVDGDGVVHAVRAIDGTAKWASTAKIPQPTDGVVADGLLYYGSPDGAVTALNVKDGTQAWRQPVSSIALRTPTVDGGVVVAVDDHGVTTSLDARSGAIRWTKPTGVDPPGTPIIVGDAIYLGVGSDSTSGKLVALNASDGTERWHIDRLLFGPSIFGSVGYSGSADGSLAAIDLTSGTVLWDAKLPAAQQRAPAVTDRVVYAYTEASHRVVALDRATGGQLWTFDLDGSNQCCVAAAKGKVFVATDAGTVYAIGGDNASIAVGPVPHEAPSAPPTAVASAAPLTDLQPKVDWIADRGPRDFIPWSLAKAPDGSIWAALGGTDQFAIFGPDGTYRETWGTSGHGKGEFDLRRANGDPYGMVAFAKDGSFYVLDVGNHRVQAFDKDRKFLREWGTLGMGPGQFSETGGIVVDEDGSVVVIGNVRAVIETYKPDGTVLSTIPAFPEELHAVSGVNRGANTINIGPNGDYFLGLVDPHVVAEVDREGKLVRTYGAQGDSCALTEQAGSVAWDGAGRMYLTQGPERGDRPGVLVFGPDGSCLGGFGKFGTGDEQLAFPSDVFVDDTGIYVSDAGIPDMGLRSAIRKFEPLPPM